MTRRKPMAPAGQGDRLLRVEIGSIAPNPRNPQRHPREQIDGLKRSLSSFGQPRPILVRHENRMIIAGHGIWQAMKEAGWTHCDIYIWDCDQATADKFMVADNRWAEFSETDEDALAAILREVAGGELSALGFPENFLTAAKGEPLIVEEIDTAPVADRFWISVRGPLKHQAKALKRLQEAMVDIPDVEIDLGTVLL